MTMVTGNKTKLAAYPELKDGAQMKQWLGSQSQKLILLK